MKRLAAIAVFVVIGTRGLAFAQAGDVNRILADTRAALGGEKKLAAVKTVTATGQVVRVNEEGSAAPVDTELAFELPDKFMKKDPVGINNGLAVMRTNGFNGDQLIDVIDQPPSLGGNVVIRFGGPGGPGEQTPEQQEAQRKARVNMARQDFARLVLGMLASSPAAYPLEFSYGGQAESPDGKADIIEVKGEANFAARLFIDTNTHLPLMLSWMAREPMVIRRQIGGPAPSGGQAQTFVNAGHASGGQAQKMTPEELEKMKQQMAEQAKAAEAKLRTVEFRLYYGDYRDVDGIKFPFSLQRSIDGKPSEQVTFEKVKVNGKIDPKKFETK